MMDVVQVERDITAWVAGVLGRTVDADVFRGMLPAGIADSVGVALGSRINDNYPALDVWNVQIMGRFADRDTALVMMHQIEAALPCYGVSSGDTELVSVTARGAGEPYCSVDEGRRKWFGSVNLIVAAR